MNRRQAQKLVARSLIQLLDQLGADEVLAVAPARWPGDDGTFTDEDRGKIEVAKKDLRAFLARWVRQNDPKDHGWPFWPGLSDARIEPTPPRRTDVN